MYLRLLAAASVLALVIAAAVIVATPGGPVSEEAVAEGNGPETGPKVKPTVTVTAAATPTPSGSFGREYWRDYPDPLGFTVEGTGPADVYYHVKAAGLLLCRASVTGNVRPDGTAGYFRVKIKGADPLYDLFSSEIAGEVEDTGYVTFAAGDRDTWPRDALWPRDEEGNQHFSIDVLAERGARWTVSCAEED